MNKILVKGDVDLFNDIMAMVGQDVVLSVYGLDQRISTITGKLTWIPEEKFWKIGRFVIYTHDVVEIIGANRLLITEIVGP